jgi:hypothetical protein
MIYMGIIYQSQLVKLICGGWKKHFSAKIEFEITVNI